MMMFKIKFNQRKISLAIIVLGIFCLLAAYYFSPFGQNNRYLKAYRISQAAEKYPPGSNEYNRLKAIANAVRRGDKNYSYSPNFNPLTQSL